METTTTTSTPAVMRNNFKQTAPQIHGEPYTPLQSSSISTNNNNKKKKQSSSTTNRNNNNTAQQNRSRQESNRHSSPSPNSTPQKSANATAAAAQQTCTGNTSGTESNHSSDRALKKNKKTKLSKKKKKINLQQVAQNSVHVRTISPPPVEYRFSPSIQTFEEDQQQFEEVEGDTETQWQDIESESMVNSLYVTPGEGTGSPSYQPRSAYTVFVGGISYKADEDNLKQFFDQYGEVVEVKLIRDKNNANQSKGYGFVMFREIAQAEAVKRQHSLFFMGKTMNVGDAFKGGSNGRPSINHPNAHNLLYIPSNNGYYPGSYFNPHHLQQPPQQPQQFMPHHLTPLSPQQQQIHQQPAAAMSTFMYPPPYHMYNYSSMYYSQQVTSVQSPSPSQSPPQAPSYAYVAPHVWTPIQQQQQQQQYSSHYAQE